MDSATNITLVFPGNIREEFTDITLEGLAGELCYREYPLGQFPLLMEFADGRKMYFNQNALRHYAEGNDTYEEIWQAMGCEGLYRNQGDLVTQKEARIDAGHLWLHRRSELILLDDDQYITCEFEKSKHLFEKIA